MGVHETVADHRIDTSVKPLEVGALPTGASVSFGKHLPSMPAAHLGTDKARVGVVLETLHKLDELRDGFRLCARENMTRLRQECPSSMAGSADRPTPRDTVLLYVLNADWGVAARAVASTFGVVPVVLNMANSRTAGGGYLNGRAAQEENMLRRTDVHYSFCRKTVVLDDSHATYRRDVTSLLNADGGLVMLDDEPRVCVRGPESVRGRHGEDTGGTTLGYRWYTTQEVFLFKELRAAAVDLRNAPGKGKTMQRRIEAQLETLVERKERHVVLGAFGCGAFGNDPEHVARLYSDAIRTRLEHFDVVVFPILDAGYDKENNYEIFQRVLWPRAAPWSLTRPTLVFAASDLHDMGVASIPGNPVSASCPGPVSQERAAELRAGAATFQGPWARSSLRWMQDAPAGVEFKGTLSAYACGGVIPEHSMTKLATEVGNPPEAMWRRSWCEAWDDPEGCLCGTTAALEHLRSCNSDAEDGWDTAILPPPPQDPPPMTPATPAPGAPAEAMVRGPRGSGWGPALGAVGLASAAEELPSPQDEASLTLGVLYTCTSKSGSTERYNFGYKAEWACSSTVGQVVKTVMENIGTKTVPHPHVLPYHPITLLPTPRSSTESVCRPVGRSKGPATLHLELRASKGVANCAVGSGAA